MKKKTKIVLGVDIAIFTTLLVTVPIVVIIPYWTTTTTSFLEKNANKTWDPAKDNGRRPVAVEMLYAFLYYIWNINEGGQNKDKLNYNLVQSEYQYTVFNDLTSTKAKCFVYSGSVKLCFSPDFNEKIFYTKNAVLSFSSNNWQIELFKGGIAMPYPKFDDNGKLIHNINI